MNSNILNLRHLTVLLMLCTALLGGTISVFAQQGGKRITGQVIDENKEPMIGVSILIVGTSTGTVTDFDGNYTLNVPQGNKELQFSYVGYETKIVAIPTSGATLNVQMKSDSQVLSDVVVIGYGTQRKSDLTGSVTNVSSKDFNMGLVSSPEQLINGKISGVQIMSNSGSPTSGSTIRVRGGASLNASNDPLIVLDGVPLEQGGISGNDGNFLSLINPNDIESMTILKDASSTAIYGSRASNGVILITTKKGSSDKLKFTFSTTNSVQTRTKLADMMSYDEFVNTIQSKGTDAQQALLGTAHTDWNDEIYQNAFGTDNNLSVAGKIAKNLPFRASVGYYNQSGLLRTDNAERYTGSITLNPSFFKDHLKLNINAKGSINKNTFANTGAIWAAATMNPTIPVYSGADNFGGYTEAIDNTGAPVNGAVMNPVGLLKMNDSHSTVKRFIGNIDADYRLHFFPDLKLHATLGYDYAQGKGSVYVPAEAAQNYTTSGLDYTYGPQKKVNRLLTLYANYNKLVESIKSSFDVTAGYDYQYWKSTTPLYYETNTLGEIQKTSKATDDRHVLLSYYGRLNYSFDDRYTVTGTFRTDGSSRFGVNNRWGYFPSVSAGWTISNEPFLKDALENIATVRIRASWGKSGNNDIGNYSSIAGISTGSYAFGTTAVSTSRLGGFADSELGWETTTQTNIGLDLGFFNSRLNVIANYYNSISTDILYNAPISAISGFTSSTTNMTDAKIRNRGFDLQVDARLLTGKVKWNVSTNISINRNKVVSLGGLDDILSTSERSVQSHITKEGYPIGSFYGYKAVGIMSELDYKNALKDREVYLANGSKFPAGYTLQGPAVPSYALDDLSYGNTIWKDVSGDGVIDTNDKTILGNAYPDFTGGFSTSLSWKGFDLGASFTYSYGGEVINFQDYYLFNVEGSSNQYAIAADRYVSDTNPGRNNVPIATRISVTNQSLKLSSYYVEDASYFRCSNITLGYTLPKRLLRKIGVESCRVYVSGDNLFTITDYRGYNPEVSYKSSNLMPGFDWGCYPLSRIYSVGLNLTF